MKSEDVERFDRTAEGYLRWWAPVLAPASVRMVDRLSRLDPALQGGGQRTVLDIGCGTGNELLEAARRWPAAHLTGLDASTGMLAVARRETGRLPEAIRERIDFIEADASAIPVPDASFDIVITAFMLQQVPDRSAVLREAHRALRPGGLLAIYGWLTDTAPFAPDAELEKALEETGIVRPPARDARSGHYRSIRSAADELRSAGFTRVGPRADSLDHRWTVADFIEYRVSTRDADLFGRLDEARTHEVVAVLRRRLDALSEDQFIHRPPVVSIVARKG